MKRLMGLIGIVAIMFVMVNIYAVTPVLASNVWDRVGANPTTTSRIATLKLMYPVDKTEVLRVVQTTFPDTVWVKRSTRLMEVSFGDGRIQRDTYVEFDSTRALAWRTTWIYVFDFLECNNIGWAYARDVVASEPAPQQVMPSDTASAAAIPPTSRSTESGSSWFDFPDWFKAAFPYLAAILALMFFLFLFAIITVGAGRILTSSPSTTPPPAPAPNTPPAPITPTPIVPTETEVERNRRLRKQLDDSDARLDKQEQQLAQEIKNLRAARGLNKPTAEQTPASVASDKPAAAPTSAGDGGSSAQVESTASTKSPESIDDRDAL